MTSRVRCSGTRTVCERGLTILLLMLLHGRVFGADWPTYRADAARSGFTSETLSEDLHLQWSWRSAHPPQLAWPRSERLNFDRAPQTVIAGGAVFFGDTTEGTITALDLHSGKRRWQFMTEGPVRFAPAAWKDRLFVVSDDGCLYCLSQADGRLLWKRRGGPDMSRRLGNERMISRWPARGGAVVVDDVVYFAAGIWPSDGIFLAALDATSGEPRWINDTSGSIYMAQPHGGAEAESGVAAQGYLVATETLPAGPSGGPASVGAAARQWLFVATGRAVPAAFDRASGRFQYFHLQRFGQKGGATAMAAGSVLFNSGIMFDVATGDALNTVGAGPLVATPEGLVQATDGAVTDYRWIDTDKVDRRGQPVKSRGLEARWTVSGISSAAELIVAGDKAVVGSSGQVTVVDGRSGRIVWSQDVDGTACGLAVSDGRLLVSTDLGTITCYHTTTVPQQATVATVPAGENSNADAGVGPDIMVSAAQRILTTSGVTDGYCLDLGCGDGGLASELARQSNLHVVAVDTDATQLEQARLRLQSAGLLGSRVTVLHAEQLSDTGLPGYFANLVVSARLLNGEIRELPEPELERLVRPWGGAVVVGTRDALQLTVRGPLAGAGNWTHQYSDAGNSLCSTDVHVKGPLGMLWFRDVDMEMPSRHGRGPGPLFYEGLLYSEGINELACVDAYNGRLLWKYPLPGILKAFDGDELMGTAGTHSNYCVADTGVYVRRDDHCLRIDRRTGVLLNRFFAPVQPNGKIGTWGFIACEGGLLLGTAADPEHIVTFRYKDRGGDMNAQLTESRSLFALDAVTGKLLWKYDAQHSIRHNAIALGGGSVYLIDRPLALADRTREKTPGPHAPGVLRALNAADGSTRWTSDHQIDGTTLALSDDHETVLMSYQPTRFALVSELGGRLAAFSTADGTVRWEKQASYASRPLINDRTIYAQGGAWDLLTGESRPFNFSRSYGCGVLAGSKHLMVFRSATLGYFDLTRNERTENFGGIRPGCWINAIPAGGLVLVPDASAGCSCSYLNQTWFALEPDGQRPPRMEPQGGAFRQAVAVRLTADDPAHEIRYTLDGSVPDRSSPRFADPVSMVHTGRLRARCFDAQGRAGRMIEGEFVIDPQFVPVEAEYWKVWDTADQPIGAPSQWSASDGVISQTSNIYQGSATETARDVERYGTFRVFQDGQEFRDGVVELQLKCSDDDTVGVAFRMSDETHHYLWASDLQRGFSVLAVKSGTSYRILASTETAYQRDTWHQLRIVLQGSSIKVLLDGQEHLAADDATHHKGTVALHTWGSDRTQFRGLRMVPDATP